MNNNKTKSKHLQEPVTPGSFQTVGITLWTQNKYEKLQRAVTQK